MKSLIISPLLTRPLLFEKLTRSLLFSGSVLTYGKEERVSPVENEELFDHLFVHNDRKFVRAIHEKSIVIF